MTNDIIRKKYELLKPTLDEAGRRRWAAAEAIVFGYGGTSVVSRATGIMRHTIRSGIAELTGSKPLPADGRQRQPGAGRKSAAASQPGLLEHLDSLVAPETRGDPMCPLRWTTKSTAKLSSQMAAAGFVVSATTVAVLLKSMGYSLQGTSKQSEGSGHPDRDAQFHYIHDAVIEAQANGEPVISVDAKKKELIGDFAQGGREWQPKGEPVRVRTHDFVDAALGKAAPYGAYDVTHNEAWVSVGVSADTAAFAVESIRTWWIEMGQPRYGTVDDIVITADGGGSNGSRVRAWKFELQRLADELDLQITVHHLPPGTSKWNKIEHRLFSAMTGNWRGRPLVDLSTIVELIASTTTKTGLVVRSHVDKATYEKGIRIDDAAMKSINLWPHKFHPEWNYTIVPRSWEKMPDG